MIRPILLLLVASTATLCAETPAAPAALSRDLATLDAEVFASYNNCDLAKFKTFFADDVEFYHDKGGLTRGADTITEQVKRNICGKVRRELVPGTMRVYPMDGYGAVQTGDHCFYEGKGVEPVGIAKFIHLWQHKDGAWKITRVISFDHQPAKK